MRRFARHRGAAKLSESIRHQFNAYTVAASAAGVGILALIPPAECVLSAGAALAGGLVMSEPAEAEIVYTATNVVIECTHLSCQRHRKVDLNHDGIADFEIFDHFVKPNCTLWATPAKNDGIEELNGKASALKAGAAIGGNKSFIVSNPALMRGTSHSGRTDGYWHYSESRYLGIKFQIKGKIHYGWARFKNSACWGATLTGYAYETTPGKAIKAGQTHGADDIEITPNTMDPDNLGPGAFLNRISDPPQPVSLGTLALGAEGVPLWRRKEEAEVTN